MSGQGANKSEARVALQRDNGVINGMRIQYLHNTGARSGWELVASSYSKVLQSENLIIQISPRELFNLPRAYTLPNTPTGITTNIIVHQEVIEG